MTPTQKQFHLTLMQDLVPHADAARGEISERYFGVFE